MKTKWFENVKKIELLSKVNMKIFDTSEDKNLSWLEYFMTGKRNWDVPAVESTLKCSQHAVTFDKNCSKVKLQFDSFKRVHRHSDRIKRYLITLFVLLDRWNYVQYDREIVKAQMFIIRFSTFRIPIF